MKRVVKTVLTMSLMFALAFCMTGCGESGKKQEAIDAFNETSTAFDNVADLINGNVNSLDDDVIGTFQEMSALLTQYKAILEGDEELTDDEYDQMIEWFGTVTDWLQEAEPQIEAELGQTFGEDNTPEDGNDSGTSDDVAFPEALLGIEAYQFDLAYTHWEFVGGLIDGAEMEAADVQAVLEACGGVLEIEFADETSTTLINGANMYPGTYTMSEDAFLLDAVFEGYEYYGVVTAVDNEYILILVNKQAPDKALYMSLIIEG